MIAASPFSTPVPGFSSRRLPRLFSWVIGSALLLLTAGTQAQDPGSGGPQPGNPDPTAVPIDGGAALLLATGAGLGLRYLRRRPA